MKISVNHNSNHITNDRIPYNGIPLRENEVLVPQLITPEDAELLGAQSVRTWYQAGVPIHVIFVPVSADQAELCLKAFNSGVNLLLDERLGPNRHARCWIPQADGGYMLCPREIDGKHNPCTGCPWRGRLEKEDRSYASLDELDEENYAPMDCVPSAESFAIEGEILMDLINEASKKCPMYADIIRLGYEGLRKKEIIDRLPVQKSRGYELYNECRRLVEDYLRN